MSLLESKTERFILLIEQFKLNILGGDSVENAIKKSAIFNKEFNFLDELEAKINSGMPLEESVNQLMEKEKSENVKSFLKCLIAKELVAQKLEELRVNIINTNRTEFEKIVSVSTKIGTIVGIIFIPLVLYFISSLAEVFEVIEIKFTITESTKIIVTLGCAAIISYLMFSKRRKNY
ncbi:MAG: hypothetical protein QXG86_02460 [Candidatus Woesearchaeota archaeon]